MARIVVLPPPCELCGGKLPCYHPEREWVDWRGKLSRKAREERVQRSGRTFVLPPETPKASKSEQLRRWLAKHPAAGTQETCDKFDCTAQLVTNIRRELGIARPCTLTKERKRATAL